MVRWIIIRINKVICSQNHIESEPRTLCERLPERVNTKIKQLSLKLLHTDIIAKRKLRQTLYKWKKKLTPKNASSDDNSK